MNSGVFVGQGRYELLSCLGRGGSGAAYRAVDRGVPFEREVCIKRLHARALQGQAAALREEARLLARVRHANVVSLLEIGEDDGGAPFLVLELIRGCNLRELVQRTVAPFPVLVAIHVACGVARALAAVQGVLPGLVHRDVTPHNVLVSTEGEVKLADFGIALSRDRERSTGPTIVKGKLGYMAPEQIRGEALDPRCDLFALGVLLYELLAGVRPCAPKLGLAEVRAVAEGAAVPLSERRPGLPRDLLSAVARLLAIRRESRCPSAEDALRWLAPFGAGDLGSLRLASILRTMEDSGSFLPLESSASSPTCAPLSRRMAPEG